MGCVEESGVFLKKKKESLIRELPHVEICSAVHGWSGSIFGSFSLKGLDCMQ